MNTNDIPELLVPVSSVSLVPRTKLKPNDYNPNKVLRENLDLLKQSILVNGWTLPIVVRKSYEIVDGFHRWTVSGEEPLLEKLKGLVPIVFVIHNEKDKAMYGTITHNRARGTHLLEPMEKIVQQLLKEGKQVDEISKMLGMSKEEIFRLSGFTRADFLNMMAPDRFNNAQRIGFIDQT